MKDKGKESGEGRGLHIIIQVWHLGKEREIGQEEP